MARTIIITVLCLLFGFLLGRWTPAGELARVRQEMKELKKSRRSGAVSTDSAALAARDFLRIDPSEIPEPGQGDTEVATDPTLELGTNEVAEVAGATDPELTPEEAERLRQETMEAQIEKAKELWQVRSELARNSFLQNIRAGEDESLRFDVLIESMNLRINSTIDQWVGQHRQEEMIRAEDGARLLHDLTGAIVLTYDELDRSMPEDWRDESGPEFKLFDFIDPGVADSLVEVEDRMQQFEP